MRCDAAEYAARPRWRMLDQQRSPRQRASSQVPQAPQQGLARDGAVARRIFHHHEPAPPTTSVRNADYLEAAVRWHDVGWVTVRLRNGDSGSRAVPSTQRAVAAGDGPLFEIVKKGSRCTCPSPFGRPGNDLLSRVLRRSTIGAGAFHGRVRNGIGCSHPAKITRSAKG